MNWTQVNLKVDEAIANEWRRRAAEAGQPSIRKWLESITIEPEPGLADRVAALEAKLTSLQDDDTERSDCATTQVLGLDLSAVSLPEAIAAMVEAWLDAQDASVPFD